MSGLSIWGAEVESDFLITHEELEAWCVNEGRRGRMAHCFAEIENRREVVSRMIINKASVELIGGKGSRLMIEGSF